MSGFTYSEGFSDTTWEGSILAVVEVEVDRFDDAAGRCFVVLGVLRPVELGSGITSNSFDTPSLGALVDGAYVEDNVNDCDTSTIEDAGYGWILNAEVTVGTDFLFYAEVFVEGTEVPDPQSIVLGDPRGSESLFYVFDPADQPPETAAAVGTAIAEGRDLLPVGDPVLSSFVYSEGFSDAEWDGTVLGIVETTVDRFDDAPGRCFVVVGTLTPTVVGDGVISSGFDTPTIGAVAGGRYVEDQVNDCETSTVEAAGYGWILDAEVSVGTAYPFYTELFVPGIDVPDLDVLVLGQPWDNEFLLFEPTVSPEVPLP